MATSGPRWITFGEESVKVSTPNFITNSQILTLPNAPWFELVPAPDSDQYIIPVLTVIRQDFTGGVYGNIQEGTVFADVGYIDGDSFFAFSGSPLDVEGQMTDDSQIYQWLISSPSGIYDMHKGKALGFTITNSSENFTLGNDANSLVVQTQYSIASL